MTKPFNYRGRWQDKATHEQLDSEYSRVVGGEGDLVAELGFEPNFTNFPCMSDPAVRDAMARAVACRLCASLDLTPVSDCRNPPKIAIACNQCGEIDGDARTLLEAVTNWNEWNGKHLTN